MIQIKKDAPKSTQPRTKTTLRNGSLRVPSNWNVGKYKYLWKSEDDAGSLGAGVIAGGELPDMGDGNQTCCKEQQAH